MSKLLLILRKKDTRINVTLSQILAWIEFKEKAFSCGGKNQNQNQNQNQKQKQKQKQKQTNPRKNISIRIKTVQYVWKGDTFWLLRKEEQNGIILEYGVFSESVSQF